jgi:NitT/TauT family transport system substrate-binding protein
MKKLLALITGLLIGSFILTACGDAATNTPANRAATSGAATTQTTALQGTVRLGFFPNLTHAQALVGLGNNTFATALGIEALLAGELDISYIGPNPAINAYVRTKGQSVRIIGGSASGGVSFIVRPEANINEARDLDGKKIATPQLGNTQDVALRKYIKEAGLKTKEQGGTVEVIPTENPNILQLFENKQIDGAWVPEPWATRLILEKKGKLFLDERTIWPDGKFVITHLLVSTKFLNEKPELVKAILSAHIQITQDIQKNPAAAKKVINDQLKALGSSPLPDAVIDASLPRIEFLIDPLRSSLLKSAESAFDLGFLGKERPDLANLYDLKLLNSVLSEKGLPTINL